MCIPIAYDFFSLEKKTKYQDGSLWQAYSGRKGKKAITIR